jgi:hypothetical protein
MKNEIEKTITVGDLFVRHPQLRPKLEQLGIDYCCDRTGNEYEPPGGPKMML